MTEFAFSRPAEGRAAHLYEIYHENSKLNSVSSSRTLTSEEIYSTSRPVRASVGASRSIAVSEGQGEFDQLLASRRSSRDLQASIAYADLVALLWSSAATTGTLQEGDGPVFALRATPSAGGLHPIDVYVIANRVEGIDRGVYYFHPFKEELQLLGRADASRMAGDGFFFQEFIAEAAAIFLLVANFQRTTWKYGERGYRLCLLDAGHLAQNLVLKAIDLGCRCVPIAGFHDALLAAELGIDGVTEALVHSVLVGGREKP